MKLDLSAVIKIVEIRNPESTRPWQHVLEPISGYLNLAQKLFIDDTLNGESFNFGPIAEQNYTVRHLIKNLSKYWNHKNVDDSFMIANDTSFLPEISHAIYTYNQQNLASS